MPPSVNGRIARSRRPTRPTPARGRCRKRPHRCILSSASTPVLAEARRRWSNCSSRTERARHERCPLGVADAHCRLWLRRGRQRHLRPLPEPRSARVQRLGEEVRSIRRFLRLSKSLSLAFTTPDRRYRYTWRSEANIFIAVALVPPCPRALEPYMTNEFVRRFNPTTAKGIAPPTQLSIVGPSPMVLEIHPAIINWLLSAAQRRAACASTHPGPIRLSPGRAE